MRDTRVEYLYIHWLEGAEDFKVGLTRNPKERLLNLTEDWKVKGKTLPLAYSQTYTTPTAHGSAVERLMHSALENFRVWKEGKSGGTEYFNIEGLSLALTTADSFCNILPDSVKIDNPKVCGRCPVTRKLFTLSEIPKDEGLDVLTYLLGVLDEKGNIHYDKTLTKNTTKDLLEHCRLGYDSPVTAARCRGSYMEVHWHTLPLVIKKLGLVDSWKYTGKGIISLCPRKREYYNRNGDVRPEDLPSIENIERDLKGLTRPEKTKALVAYAKASGLTQANAAIYIKRGVSTVKRNW